MSPRAGGPATASLRWPIMLVLWLALALAGCTGNMAPVSGPGMAARGSHYIVQQGDTLYSIAWRNGLDYRAVARWNRISPPYRIYPGQRLRLAIPAARVASAPPTAAPAKREPTARRPAAKAPAKSATAVSGSARTPVWRWPVAGRVVRNFAADAQGKQGIEVSGRLGEPVRAAAAGRVVYAGDGLRGYGNLVILKHDGRYLTAYGYNRELKVKEGDAVSAGQPIATMGMGSSQQPALHFELRRDGKPVDPVSYLPAR